MYRANQIADFFLINLNKVKGDTISPLKLQKLVYYAQAWHLSIFDTPLFEESIEAWVHGPVIPSVYERFKDTTMYSSINVDAIEFEQTDFFDGTRDLLFEVNAIYGEHTASYLEELTHSETPWKEARKGVALYQKSNNLISPKSMVDYYSQFLKDGEKSS